MVLRLMQSGGTMTWWRNILWKAGTKGTLPFEIGSTYRIFLEITNLVRWDFGVLWALIFDTASCTLNNTVSIIVSFVLVFYLWGLYCGHLFPGHLFPHWIHTPNFFNFFRVSISTLNFLCLHNCNSFFHNYRFRFF